MVAIVDRMSADNGRVATSSVGFHLLKTDRRSWACMRGEATKPGDKRKWGSSSCLVEKQNQEGAAPGLCLPLVPGGVAQPRRMKREGMEVDGGNEKE